jgi:hypothetical protein
MKIDTITFAAWDSHTERTLSERFLIELQGVIDSGGTIISITADDRRRKVAYVIRSTN